MRLASRRASFVGSSHHRAYQDIESSSGLRCRSPKTEHASSSIASGLPMFVFRSGALVSYAIPLAANDVFPKYFDFSFTSGNAYRLRCCFRVQSHGRMSQRVATSHPENACPSPPVEMRGKNISRQSFLPRRQPKAHLVSPSSPRLQSFFPQLLGEM